MAPDPADLHPLIPCDAATGAARPQRWLQTGDPAVHDTTPSALVPSPSMHGRLDMREPAADAQLTAQLSAELGVSGDRLARLLEALTAVGNRVGDVRLVRVFAADKAPKLAEGADAPITLAFAP